MSAFGRELKKIVLFLKKDIKLEFSYKFSILLRSFSIVLFCLVFFFLSRMIKGAPVSMLEKYSGDYFAFALIGMSFYMFFSSLLNSFSSRLREEQLTGTLEAIFLSPVRVPTFLTGISALSLVRGIMSISVFFLVGVFFLKANIAVSNLPLFGLVLLLCTVNFLSVGILASSFILVFKRGNPVNWFLESLFLLAGGVVYPVSVLPGWMQRISEVLPITYSLKALRELLIPGAETDTIESQILKLAVGALILFPLALISFRLAMQAVKKHGTLSHY